MRKQLIATPVCPNCGNDRSWFEIGTTVYTSCFVIEHGEYTQWWLEPTTDDIEPHIIRCAWCGYERTITQFYRGITDA